MTLKIEDVRNIAQLARLQIDDADIEQYATDLSSILALAEQMNAVDTTNVTPMAHPLDATQRLRPDEVTETNQRDKFQAIAPDVKNGLYRVPRVIE
ncbi:MAG: Asp-tRNA(Asn)/Glu-tRNA(Gln) amidotransferase subunit GatC [Gammaproteobacteria bacterium]|jgi:aspartyl-tRNA(Asn)/glutamyl-tRNA(Gln) amidotransferase subunit C|nr:Asp-tRNA(Asn)/Glu-tRNA(Gln) amidotransferase subunit GatC [Gammaproteobacteria bacterium]MCZ6488473.1 Asp-tRNA(Asn)/Glu-tRNA(Gln) amidotransferase subunit GatC [Gammaproteobacteria bacterium]MCZ6578272.1 Asp-tRNA(Asn)/Glu-tRNA(Gln) amidotransferase subunit GatC [Gammaproteobacteria bacterium]MCZ6883062.1 Asp-tRNA(Asn)/Glu-tRNA(Gln) amidotransferase subunit GatC [Gammaproteobacteria bacterium]